MSLCSCHLLWADELKEKRAIVLGWGRKGRKVLPLLFWGVCLMSLARFQPGEGQTSQLPAVTQNFMSLSPQCAAAEKWPTSSVKEWIGSCLCASKSFCTGTQNVISWGQCVLWSGQIMQMETPPSSAVGKVVFLLESKNWENGSNNYITDATKQAVGVEGSGKCFHLRVLSQTVKCTVGWGKSAHPFVSIRLFFRYRRVYLSASATWVLWTSAAFLGRKGYFPSP